MMRKTRRISVSVSTEACAIASSFMMKCCNLQHIFNFRMLKQSLATHEPPSAQVVDRVSLGMMYLFNFAWRSPTHLSDRALLSRSTPPDHKLSNNNDPDRNQEHSAFEAILTQAVAAEG